MGPEMIDPVLAELEKQYWQRPSPLLMRKILAAWRRRGEGASAGVQRLKVALLASFTVDSWPDYLEAQGALDCVSIDVQTSQYNQFRQDAYRPNSWLTEMKPDVIILAVEPDALIGDVVRVPLACPSDEFARAFGAGVQELVDIVCHLVARFPQAKVLVNNWIVPAHSSLGILDGKLSGGPQDQYRKANLALGETLRSVDNAYVVELDNLASRIGKDRFVDRRMLLLGDKRVDERHLPRLARLYGRYWRAFLGKGRKCIVLDLDNTLWGGILGEDGFDGIDLDPVKHPGSAFVRFQQTLLDLYHRGVILAINSKNNWDDAIHVLERHPYMVLRPNHFAAMAINWDDKPLNMTNIAKELNIGLDSIVFLDDDPHQCALMEVMLPAVKTFKLPDDPAEYDGFLASLELFDGAAYSEEDAKRGQMYAEQRLRREELERTADSSKGLEEYYRNLQMECVIGVADEFTIPRVAQLTQRTNQFNLTTRRYSEADIKSFLGSDHFRVSWISLRDRFGDLGLVGVVILKETETAVWEIDTLLMSCRALGRDVETAFVQKNVKDLFEKGAREVIGVYEPTAKNSQVACFYREMGFAEEATGRFRLRTPDVLKRPPVWIKVEVRP